MTLIDSAGVVTNQPLDFSEPEAWTKTAPYGAVVVAACAPSCKPREATR